MRNFFKAAAVFAALWFMGSWFPARAEEGPAPSKFALNMYHFNIQYVVGDEDSMRRIVKQSFEPLVDFYLAHPGRGADFEMQGLMIEYMAEHYPEVLDKFRKLVNSGQCELVTFHYADQMLLAFPRHDQEWSIRLNDRLLEERGIKRSGVIFTQEAQFGEGFAKVALPNGYHTAVMTTSQYVWFQDDERFPYFTVNGLNVITNRDAVEPKSGIKVKWIFLGDGELVATAGISPYFPGLFRKNPVRLWLLDKQMSKLEAEGYKIATVSEYVEALKAAGVKPAPLRPILDSPWRPEDASGLFQWMGKYASPRERDYDMRTRNWQVRSLLVEAEREGLAPSALATAWGYMLNAEVTDPSGWFPFQVEIDWDYQMMDQVKKTIEEAVPPEKFKELSERAAQGPKCGGEVTEPPVKVELFGTAEGGELSWSRLLEPEGGFCVAVSWTGKGDGGVAFPWTGEAVEYSPAMMEDTLRRIASSEIKGKDIHLALPNGLIGLGDGKYLVRDNQKGCLAAGLYFKERKIKFEVTKGSEERYALFFYLLENPSERELLDFANRVNRVAP